MRNEWHSLGEYRDSAGADHLENASVPPSPWHPIERIRKRSHLILALFLTACSGGETAPPVPVAVATSPAPPPPVTQDEPEQDTTPFVIASSGQSDDCGANNDFSGEIRREADVKVFWESDFIVSETDQKPYGTAYPSTQNFTHWFAIRAHEETARPIRIILLCRGGSPIDWWLDGVTPEGENIRQAHAELIDEAFQHPDLTRHGTTKIDVFLWHQGQANWDVRVYPSEEYYRPALLEVFARYRANDWMDDSTPIIVGELAEPGKNRIVGTSANQNAVLSHFNGEGNIWTAYTKDLEADSSKLHFTGESLQTAGYERYWQAWENANAPN